MITYDEAINFLYTQIPMFQREGASAYKPGLNTAHQLDEAFGKPHTHYPTIHIAGTNGKGSTAHTIAAVMQSAGYKVGLYTSPHLVDFRERIRVNGSLIPKENVCDFVERFQKMNLNCHPSFFELTMIMAFEHFSQEKVDVAVIEVGLGGRLDSTNIIHPILSIITNISFDHTAFLGNTLPEIAAEKAGIIKTGIPVIIGEAEGTVKDVFIAKAQQERSPIYFVEETNPYFSVSTDENGHFIYNGTIFGDITGELSGECQLKNSATILTALDRLRKNGWKIPSEAVKEGFAHVGLLTGLAGRWMTINERPLVICDTGHNIGGWKYISHQLSTLHGEKHMVIGFVNDKDISHILELMPKDAHYYFTRADIPRALPAEDLAQIASTKGLQGIVVPTVIEAYKKALDNVAEGDMIFVGGSTFVVADLLSQL